MVHEQSLENIRVNYLKRIRYVLAGAVQWLVNTDFKNSRLLLGVSAQINSEATNPRPLRYRHCEDARVHVSFDQDYNRSCYATIAVWYVMKHCPVVVTSHFIKYVLGPKLALAYQSVRSRASKDREPTPKNDILQWYHMSTLFLICSEAVRMADGIGPDWAFEMVGVKRKDFLATQQRFQRYASRLKVSKGVFYSSKHEELDRVVLLGEELDLESIEGQGSDAAAQISSRVRQTRLRLEARDRTAKFNQGPTARGARHEPLHKPWELLCTNHELYFRIAPSRNTESVKKRVFGFMTSDYSFMASWDRSDGDMIAKWWDFEPTAIVCATIIDLKNEGM